MKFTTSIILSVLVLFVGNVVASPVPQGTDTTPPPTDPLSSVTGIVGELTGAITGVLPGVAPGLSLPAIGGL